MGIRKMNGPSENPFMLLQKQIEEAQKANKPIDSYVKQQINLLKDAHDEFVKQAQAKGYELTNPRVGEIEVQQISSMKQLAQKIGLPVQEYDDMIKAVRIRVFGEANYERFFGKDAQ